mgnify:CR=1 FL=1
MPRAGGAWYEESSEEWGRFQLAKPGRAATFLLVPKEGVALASHVGHRVQVSAVMLDPGEDDAEIEITDRTTVDPDDAPDRTKRATTEVEIEDARHGEYTVVSVKPLPGPCPAF